MLPRFLLGSASLVVLAAPLAAQQARKLSGPLAPGVAGSIDLPYQVSPDGQRYVYGADRDGNGTRELWALEADGKEPALLLGTDASDDRLTPDGKRVVHSIGDTRFGRRELFVVPSDASAPARSLTGLLPSHAHIPEFQFALDGRLVYRADADSDEVFELYGVALESGAPTKLNSALASGGSVLGYALARTSALVLYLADQDTDEVAELYVVPADGSQPPRKLPIPLVPGGDVGAFHFVAADARVLYLADQEEDERFELFSIAADGSEPPRKLNAPLVAGGDVGLDSPVLSPTWDGQHVLFSADQDVDGLVELFRAPVDGSSAPVRLCALGDLQLAGLSWDSGWVLLQGIPFVVPNVELFSVPSDGSGPLRPLSGPMAPGGNLAFAQISADSSRVVYVADQETDGIQELYGVPVDGSSPPVKLSGPMVPGGSVSVDFRRLGPGFYVMADGVMYEADQEVDGLSELYFVADGAPARKLAEGPVQFAYPSYAAFRLGEPLADFGRVLFLRDKVLWSVGVEVGAVPEQLDEPDAGGIAGDVEAFRASADGSRVVYRAREEGDRHAGLYSVPSDKPSLKEPLLEDVQLLEPVGAFELALDEARVVFLGRLVPEWRLQLHSVLVEGGELPRALGPALGAGELVEEFWLAPGGESVLFAAWRAGQRELWVAPVDGSAPALFLAPAFNDPGVPRFAPDASRVVFHQVNGLYSVPLDGSAPAVRVNETNRRAETDFQVTADGSRVVFRTLAATGRSQLFVTPLDGSGQPVRISDEMPTEGDVLAFALTADGSRAVYRADAVIDQRFELFSVPLDGSLPPARLHPIFPADRDVQAFALAPDSTRVAFTADLRVNGQPELYSVPIDAGQPPVRISVDLGAGGSIDGSFRITADARRVVYRARLAGSQGLTLFSTPIQSARGSRLLSPALPGSTVGAFDLSADGRTVAFGMLRPNQTSSFHAAPVSGLEKATLLAERFTGTLHGFALAADGSRVTWRSDQESLGVIELFSATIGLAGRSAYVPGRSKP